MAAEQNIKWNVGWATVGSATIVLYEAVTQLDEHLFAVKWNDTAPTPAVERWTFLTRDYVNALIQTQKAYVDPLLDYTKFWNGNAASWLDNTVNPYTGIGSFVPSNANATLARLYTGQGLYTLKGDGITVPADVLARQNLPGGSPAPVLRVNNAVAAPAPPAAPPATDFLTTALAFLKANWILVAVAAVVLYPIAIQPLLVSIGLMKKPKRRK